jgi:hypothetical protein
LWLPADLRRALRAIAAREHMTVPQLLRVAVRELVDAYQPPAAGNGHQRDRLSPTSPQRVEDTLETVWRPHRDAPSLLGMRESKAR